MASMRLVGSLALLALALGAAGALAAWSLPDAGASGTYRVEVLGPEGALLDETVQLEEATVLRALEAACERRGVALELERFPGMGTYVRAIAGHRADGPDGWVYEVLREGAWVNGDRSAELFALQKDDAVRWSWTAR